jgi:hypothetical protein
MKIEVGKYYRTRDDNKAHISFPKNDHGRLMGSVQIGHGVMGHVWDENGKARSDGHESTSDLVAEWDAPMPLNITADDIGRKVRLRDGAITLITGFYGSENYPVTTGRVYYKTSGQCLAVEKEHKRDIIEFIKEE